MPPSARTRASMLKTAKRARRTILKKPVAVKPKQKIQKKPPPPPSSPSKSSSLISGGFSKTESIEFDSADASATSSPCSTPKAQRFRIPQIVSCPPAPKKQRVSSNCLFRRSPIAFFAPPDLELFFYYANRGISV
ncbi:cyclin-dependent protein kinase inhibitor SMR9 [Argentina anserina]|uniref:cyclin-dependent protein kinase inhibitor SMR9 n=1 Tax=Argentina anserina TaxID=57926 RepID=UPI0021764502|nr:cyclin-dependent protein kinase inhibitor SMR9 [Potentilla anserina]